MKNHHFFNLYINCAGLFLSFFIELNNFFLSHLNPYQINPAAVPMLQKHQQVFLTYVHKYLIQSEIKYRLFCPRCQGKGSDFPLLLLPDGNVT